MTEEERAGIHATDGDFKVTINGKEHTYKPLCMWQRKALGLIFSGVEIDKSKLTDGIESYQYSNQFVNTHASKASKAIAIVIYGRSGLLSNILTRPFYKKYIDFKARQLQYKITAKDFLDIVLAISVSEDVANFITATTFMSTTRAITHNEVVAITK